MKVKIIPTLPCPGRIALERHDYDLFLPLREEKKATQTNPRYSALGVPYLLVCLSKAIQAPSFGRGCGIPNTGPYSSGVSESRKTTYFPLKRGS